MVLKAFDAPWEYFLYFLIKYGTDTKETFRMLDWLIREGVAIHVRAFTLTALVVYLTMWYQTKHKTAIWHGPTASPIWHKLLDVFVRCQPFNVAWSWNEVGASVFILVFVTKDCLFVHCVVWLAWQSVHMIEVLLQVLGWNFFTVYFQCNDPTFGFISCGDYTIWYHQFF